MDSSRTPELLYAAPNPQWPWSFTPDGKTLVFDEGGGVTHIMATTIGSSDTATPVVQNDTRIDLASCSRMGNGLSTPPTKPVGWKSTCTHPGARRREQVSTDGGDRVVA